MSDLSPGCVPSGRPPTNLNLWVHALVREGRSVVDCADEARFTRNYQLYDPEAEHTGGDVLEYTILR
jgi:hypothetical protein